MLYRPAKKGPQGMDNRPLFTPNNHSDFMDIFWSLKNIDVLVQSLNLRPKISKNLSCIFVYSSWDLVTSGKVKCLCGQLNCHNFLMTAGQINTFLYFKIFQLTNPSVCCFGPIMQLVIFMCPISLPWKLCTCTQHPHGIGPLPLCEQVIHS